MVRRLKAIDMRIAQAVNLKFILEKYPGVSSGNVRPPRSIIKAARVHLGLDQAALAKAAGLSRHAVIEFENAKTVPHESTWETLQGALEARGIVFTNGDKPGFFFDKDKAVIPT